MSITVRSQTELDNVPIDTEEIIRIEFGTVLSPAVIHNAYKQPIIIDGRFFVRIWAGCAHAFSHATVEGIENSHIVAFGDSKITARDNCLITANEKSCVTARDNSCVRAFDETKVYAFNNSSVSAHGRSTVIAHHNAKVRTYGNRCVTNR